MTNQTSDTARRRRPLLLGVAVAVVALLVAAVIAASLSAAPGATAPSGSPTPTASADPDVTATPTPTPSESPDPEETAEPDPTSTPEPLDGSAEVEDGVTLEVAKLEAVAGEASQPGEVAGPSVRFTLRVHNDTDAAISLTTAAVNVYYGEDQTPAIQLLNPGGTPFPQSVKADSRAEGVFVFSVPVESRDRVRLTVDYSVDEPQLVFEGPAPR